MRIGTDGSVVTPDPEVIVNLDDEDIGVVLDALRFLLERCAEQDKATVSRTLAKFERIRESKDDG